MINREEVLNESLSYFNGDDLASQVWVDKYCLRDKNGNLLELSPIDMHKRLSSEFLRIESKYKNPLSEKEIFRLLDGFKYLIPGGSPMAGIGNNHLISSLSNCFVIHNNYDHYGAIFVTDEEQVQLMKRRGGVGHDLSMLRPAGASTSNSATSATGVVPFMKRYSNSTGEVAQVGRRGALMLSLSINHPDAENFIKAKQDRVNVVYANVSLRVTDAFMRAVVEDDDFYQTFPINLSSEQISKEFGELTLEETPYDELIGGKTRNTFLKRVKARKLWKMITEGAWAHAEPGVLFWDRIINESPAKGYGEYWREKSTNPCLHGDTIIAVADGRNGVKIKDLVGTRFPVYSARPNKSNGNRGGGWKCEIKSATAIESGVKPVVKVNLSNGSSFIVTEDHLLAKPDLTYIKAKDSVGSELGKFYSFSNKNNNKSYRVINSFKNGYLSGYSRQYRMIWEFLYGKYDGKNFDIDHIDSDSTNDLISNLRLIGKDEHKEATDRFGLNNPIQKLVGTRLHKLMNKRKNILANAKKYDLQEEELVVKPEEFDLKYSKEIEDLKEKKNINVDFSGKIFVESVEELNISVPVYDLIVQDNHNFYIITKTDDDKFLNSSGVLVHNCGELPLPEHDSCRLMALNLYSYVVNPFQPDSYFDFEKFKVDVRNSQRLMDDLVDLEIEKVELILLKIKNDIEPDYYKRVEFNLWNKILGKACNGRRTGLGVTAEGDMLAALGITYGSDESIEFTEKVHKILAIESYISSIILASERGCFKEWKLDNDSHSQFLQRLIPELPKQYRKMYQFTGRRNIGNLTIAPTGSVSILTQTTSGIEPAFLIYYKRRRKISPDATVYDYKDEVGDKWLEYNVFHHKFIEWFDKNWYKLSAKWFDFDYKPELEALSDDQVQQIILKSPYNNSTSNDVNWLSKVKMQGAIQKWVDHSISVTVNIPKETPIEVVDKIYQTAWESGCKGCTIYRDGSRSGVLVKKESSNFEYQDGVKRPKVLPCTIHRLTALRQKWVVLVGLNNDKPFEIFALRDIDNQTFPEKITEGLIKKERKRVYSLTGIQSGKEYYIEDISKYMPEDESVDTRKYSLMLRSRVHPKHIVEQIDKYATITSFDRAISRVLKLYLNGYSSKDKCEKCGSTLEFVEGCLVCKGCGFSKCG